MELELDPLDKNFPRVLAAKNAIMSAVLTATVRTNAGSLRKQGGDRIAELLEEVKRSEDPITKLFADC